MSPKKKESWKKREGVVYSTNNSFEYKTHSPNIQSVEHNFNALHIYFTKKGRGGKCVTIIEGLPNNPLQLGFTAQKIKQECGVGGSVKNGEIIIQGTHVEKVKKILVRLGFNVK